MAATGVGAVAGALWLASRKSVLGLGRVIPGAACTFAVSLFAFSFSRSLVLSMALLVLVGGGMMVQMAASNTILQTVVDEDKRGRVMSLYGTAFFGMAPIGSLVAGALGARIGAPATLACGAVVTFVAALLFVRKLPDIRRAARPTYVRLGILPEIARGLQAGADLPPVDAE
jgi:predicted MFS family arabinose efflux permease